MHSSTHEHGEHRGRHGGRGSQSSCVPPAGHGRGHHPGDHGHRHHDDRPEHRGEGRHGGGRGHGRRGGGEGRDRAGRGDARFVLLDALRDGPKHGYDIIKSIEERSGGNYVPSPGTVYPTLQYLEDAGLVSAEAVADRRVYQLTEAGVAELAAKSQEIAAFWNRFQPGSSQRSNPEIDFLRDAIDDLTRTALAAVETAGRLQDSSLIGRTREAVERCENEIRVVISNAKSGV
jgi:DNA-binding PadR family transcriptional regulator